MVSEGRFPPFHLAFPVDDLAAAERFYVDQLGCAIGRRSDRWIDFNFFGHQITAHHSPDEVRAAKTNKVDGQNVPVRHFGAILSPDAWRALADRLQASEIDFLIEPQTRFSGEPGEQGTFFVQDPAGNGLEFKCFADMAQVFEY
ncbi:MAG: VOC family protein [Pseudomonadota bacterium]